MNDLVDRNCELPANKANLNKAKLHTDTHMHTYTDTDSALITSESTETENLKRTWKKDRSHTTVAVAGVPQLPTLGKSLLTLNEVSRR